MIISHGHKASTFGQNVPFSSSKHQTLIESTLKLSSNRKANSNQYRTLSRDLGFTFLAYLSRCKSQSACLFIHFYLGPVCTTNNSLHAVKNMTRPIALSILNNYFVRHCFSASVKGPIPHSYRLNCFGNCFPFVLNNFKSSRFFVVLLPPSATRSSSAFVLIFLISAQRTGVVLRGSSSSSSASVLLFTRLLFRQDHSDSTLGLVS